MDEADTETAHSKVKKAMLEHSRAEKEAAREASQLKGSVPSKQIEDAKARATKACDASTKANIVTANAKAALSTASAELKATQNIDTLNKIREAQRKFKNAQTD